MTGPPTLARPRSAPPATALSLNAPLVRTSNAETSSTDHVRKLEGPPQGAKTPAPSRHTSTGQHVTGASGREREKRKLRAHITSLARKRPGNAQPRTTRNGSSADAQQGAGEQGSCAPRKPRRGTAGKSKSSGGQNAKAHPTGARPGKAANATQRPKPRLKKPDARKNAAEPQTRRPATTRYHHPRRQKTPERPGQA